MSAKDVLAKSGYSDRGMGTKVSEYSEQGPFHCGDCVFVSQKDSPSKGKGLCKEKHVLKDPQVPTDKKSKLKIIDLIHGCCRYVKYPKGYTEESNDED